MSDSSISHAFVLPDQNFHEWLQALAPYSSAFERVAIVRSPAGNDLNRFRNVSAVTAPLTWYQDDPLRHIRRIYPMVVRVDVVKATTPQQLKTLMAARISKTDRYGQQTSEGTHLYDRFVLDWPTLHRPLEILQPFNSSKGPGITIRSRIGAKVTAAVAGKVTKQWAGTNSDILGLGQYVQVTTTQDGMSYVVTYAGLSKVSVPLNTLVDVGDVVGEAAGDTFQLIVQQPGHGMSGFTLPDIINPTDMLYVQNLRLRPIDTGLRVRTLPSTAGIVLGQINPWDSLEPMEMHGRTLGKVGKEGQWMRIKLPDGREGYSAAWFLEAFTKDDIYIFPGVNPVGVNLDARHALGTPDASRLGDMGWIRMGYNVSNNVGSEDINAAFNRYLPLAERYKRAGYRVMFTTSHQTYGEGKNEFWPWNDLSDSAWTTLINRFAAMMRDIARQWAGRGLVDVWQIWNEQDAGPNAVASVPVPVKHYARMVTEVTRAIRSSDAEARIITGGHTSGPYFGSQYARDTISQLPTDVRLDGIAIHPYGRGPVPGERYTIFGHIDDSIEAYSQVYPDRPLWITEWGVLDHPNDPPQDVANYATHFISYLKARYPGRIATMLWYAWAQGMHNGYGLVDKNGNPRPPLTERFLQA
ncbi:peptidoglycan DD-metalloendopeptidase family protein [Phototrophicus methaneseepsis]|uniref:Peptidoglycan DD-metalloendopeptidase family protein n=1 Tax=Phototrophicus methaneseepsis TaxID=2710758 RepID=A0A7S8EBL3_9CHLR|nr:cellulase family glycosylhydrolase [Phototrophicus methaneseepsis]QPC83919.1 peptidoglycan DD-metalloendopeptidase family protein [Phototrophicus methaneseepsis]